jgi:hypothetical protein
MRAKQINDTESVFTEIFKDKSSVLCFFSSLKTIAGKTPNMNDLE